MFGTSGSLRQAFRGRRPMAVSSGGGRQVFCVDDGKEIFYVTEDRT